MDKKELNFNFEFITPAERIMSMARTLVSSPDEDCRAVAKAVLDVVAEATTIQKAMAEDRDVDIAPYFDFWFADAIECANVMLNGENQDARDLARCLIEMEKASIKSKE